MARTARAPYFDQALGKPTERVEHRLPGSIEELDQWDEQSLERLVAQGRAERLKRLESERESDEDGDVVG
jgi:hypothetical protein